MIIERGEVVGDPFYLFGRAGVGREKSSGGDMQIFTDIEEHSHRGKRFTAFYGTALSNHKCFVKSSMIFAKLNEWDKKMPYGDFSDSSVLINSGTVSIVVENGALEEIDVTVEGDFTTAFESTDDFGNAANAQIKLDMNIVVNDDGNEFEPFDSVKDAK